MTKHIIFMYDQDKEVFRFINKDFLDNFDYSLSGDVIEEDVLNNFKGCKKIIFNYCLKGFGDSDIGSEINHEDFQYVYNHFKKCTEESDKLSNNGKNMVSMVFKRLKKSIKEMGSI